MHFRYESVKSARVQIDSSHGRKPYGFVRFAEQEDQRDALIHMNGFTGMGEKPIKVSCFYSRVYKKRNISKTLHLVGNQYVSIFFYTRTGVRIKWPTLKY